jgi:hypothetical protein
MADDELNKDAKKRIDRVKEQQNLEARIIQELEENEEVQKYLEPYGEFLRDTFLESYTHHKYMWIQYADSYERQAESDALEYRPDAEECLWEIQQKKLFDLQCHWRAGEISLEGVQVTIDFRHWDHNIKLCPFLEPITEEEVDMYISYLESSNTNPRHKMIGWQEYVSFKREYQNETGGVMPDWYEFHNSRTGNSALFLLPDRKGEAEDRYLKAKRQQEVKEQKKAGTYKEPNPGVPRPEISAYDRKDVEAFIRKFESKAEYTRYLHFRNSKDKGDLNETIEVELRLLQNSTEPIPIESHSDWREAIQLAADAYKNRMIARAMPTVYEDYLFKQQTGISHTAGSSEKRKWVKIYKQRILEGRKVLGEPENFDY